MLAVAVLAAAPGNHVNAVKANAVPQDSSGSSQMVLIDDSLQVLDGGPDPSPDGHSHP